MRTYAIFFAAVLLCAPAALAQGEVGFEIEGTANPGGSIRVGLRQAGSPGLAALDLGVAYNPAVLAYESAEPGPVATGAMIECREAPAGRLKLGLIVPDGVTGDGVVGWLRFRVIGGVGTACGFSYTDVKGYSGQTLAEMPLRLTIAEVRVAAPGAPPPVAPPVVPPVAPPVPGGGTPGLPVVPGGTPAVPGGAPPGLPAGPGGTPASPPGPSVPPTPPYVPPATGSVPAGQPAPGTPPPPVPPVPVPGTVPGATPGTVPGVPGIPGSTPPAGGKDDDEGGQSLVLILVGFVGVALLFGVIKQMRRK